MYKPVGMAKSGTEKLKVLNEEKEFGWRTPCTMIMLFLLGVASAVGKTTFRDPLCLLFTIPHSNILQGHHVYYTSLQGQPVENGISQQSKIRYGSALAFLTKTTLSSALLIGYDQRIWATFKKRYLKIETIDAIIGAPHTMLSFLSLEMIEKAKIATVLVLFAW